MPKRTDRLVVRAFADDDAAELARAFASPEVLWWDPAPFTLERAREWIAKARDGYARSGCGLYAVELLDGGRLLGDCGLVARTVEGEDLVEIGWHLERSAWGRGYATEAARAVLAHAEGLGVRRVCSLIVPTNEGSRRVAEKLGMTLDRAVVHAGLPHDLWVLDLVD
ncbi:MAG: GNAT family N-acetyltransferase [Deltaproteobacteria bacterium]